MRIENLERAVANLRLEWVEQLDRLHRIAKRLSRAAQDRETEASATPGSSPSRFNGLSGVALARELRREAARALRERDHVPGG